MNIPQGPWNVDDFLTFTVTTHRFDTGALTDADSVPSYRVYEDETGTAILTGSMAKLDDTNTTGFYSEQLTLSAANGFEAGKSYSVYVTATVNSVTGGQSGGFKVVVPIATKAVTDLLVNAHAEPLGIPAADESPLDKLGYLYAALRNRVDVTASKKQFYNDGGTVEWEKDLSDNGTTYTETEGNAP